MLTLDLDGRKSRRQRAAGNHVLGADRLCRVVETDEVAGAHVHRANAEAHFTRIDAVEVDDLLERRLEEFGLVKARRFEATCGLQPWCRLAQGEEPGRATEQRPGRAHLVEKAARDISSRRVL